MAKTSEFMPGRRDVFKHAAVAAVSVAAGRLPYVQAQTPAAGTSPFFPGFRTFKVQTSGATINGVIGGQGPPLLLLHGSPLSHISSCCMPFEAIQATTVLIALTGCRARPSRRKSLPRVMRLN